MNNTMEHLKIPHAFLTLMRIDHDRIKAQIEMMAENPTAYTGEALKTAISVIQWHLSEQAEQLDLLDHKANKINRLIDQANVIYIAQGGSNE